MNILIKAAGIAIISAIAAMAIKKQASEISVVILICAGAAILWSSLDAIDSIMSFIDDLSGHMKLAETVLSPLVKIVAISIVSKISADVCRDAGSGSLASCVELAGCAIAVTLSLPLLMSVIKLVASV